MRRWWLWFILGLASLPALGQSGTSPVNGYCNLGGTEAVVSGLQSTNPLQGIIPGCTVTTYLHGTQTLATIFADSNNTPLSNPFTANAPTSPNSGAWIFWAANGACYDVVGSGGVSPITYPAPITLTEVCLGTGGGGGGGAISAENFPPVFFVPAGCNSPSTCSDITFTPYPWGTSVVYAGPPPGALPGAFVYQWNFCTGSGTTASCLFLAPSKFGHSLKVLAWGHETNMTGNPTDTFGNSITTSINAGGYSANVAFNIIGSTPTSPIDTVSWAVNGSTAWGMYIEEVGGVPTTSPLESHQHAIAACGGTSVACATVTTSNNDLIECTGYQNPAQSNNSPAIYSTTAPYKIDLGSSLNMGGLFPTAYTASVDSNGNVASGTITPSFGMNPCHMESDTYAWQWNGSDEWQWPRPRLYTLQDAQNSNWIPQMNANQSIIYDGQQFQALTYGSGLTVTDNAGVFTLSSSAGGGTVTNFSAGNLPPLFTTSVATSTTTPALTFALSNFAADNIFGNFTGSSAPPSTQGIPACANDGVHALSYPSHTLTCSALTTSGGGINSQTSNYTLQSSDFGKLVKMNCGSSCTVTLLATPASNFKSCIQSVGTSTATVSLNSLNYNGSSSVPVLIKYFPMCFYSDGTNYFGDPPPVAGTNVTLTAASNGVTIAASAASSLAFSALTSATNTTAAMVVGSGASLAASGSGTIAATSVPFSGVSSGSNTTATMTVGTGGTITVSGSGVNNANEVNGAAPTTSLGIAGTNSSGQIVAATVTHTCEVIWGGSGTSFALQSGDDAIANQSCLNELGVTQTITAVYCRSDNSSNTTTVNPTFGSAGTGTTICSGALTCGSSGAYSSTCTVSNGALANGSNINPVMGGTLTGTSIHVVVISTATK